MKMNSQESVDTYGHNSEEWDISKCELDDQGLVVRKPVNVNPGLNLKLKHYVFFFKNVFHLLRLG